MTQSPSPSHNSAVPRKRWFGVTILDIVDVVVYFVVISLFVVFFPRVISESLGLVLLTAILLKIVLEVVVWLKTLINGGSRNHQQCWRECSTS